MNRSRKSLWIGGVVAAGLVVLTPLGALAASGWSIVQSPNSSSAPNSDLFDVACTTTNECWAVGETNTNPFVDDRTLIERRAGHAWTIVSSPNATSNNDLVGVTCVSTKDCWAVGFASNGTNYQTLTERWNGAAWTIVASLNAGTLQDNFLGGVACVSGSDCWAAGYFGKGVPGFPYQTLTEHWNGKKWIIVSSPNPGGMVEDNVLQDVTCTSESNCWTVGYTSPFGSNNASTLTEHWNGTAWSAVSSPNPGVVDDLLSGVTCTSKSQCWAVGSQIGTGNYQTLIERWNGSSWAVTNSPDTSSAQANYFYDVSCESAADCWSVGIYSAPPYQTLTAHWNGSSWTIAPSQNTGATQNNYLFGVTCVSDAGCWAAGYSTDNTNTDHTLIERGPTEDDD